MIMIIPLRDTTFNFDAISDQIIGAGVLPVSVDEHGEFRILLGKERYINHWRGSLKWSGFEGGRKMGEAVEWTAAREFIEESIGVVDIDGVAATVDSVAEYVVNNQYVARIVLCILHGDNNSERRFHVTYMIQVPYDTEYVSRFNGRRRIVTDLQHRQQQMNRLFERVRGLPNEIDDPDILAVVDVCIEEERSVIIETIDGEGVTKKDRVAMSPEEAEMYVRWHRARIEFTEECDRVQHVCPHILRVERNACRVIQSVRINEDFIEKQHVQWWSHSQLKQVLENGGFLNNEFFRAYFLPVLQRAVQELDRFKCDASTYCPSLCRQMGGLRIDDDESASEGPLTRPLRP